MAFALRDQSPPINPIEQAQDTSAHDADTEMELVRVPEDPVELPGAIKPAAMAPPPMAPAPMTPAAVEPADMEPAVMEPVARQPRRWEHFNDIVVYAPGSSELANKNFIVGMRRPLVAEWKVQIKKHPNLDLDAEELLPYLKRLKSFVAYLDTIEITPKLWNEVGIRSCFDIVQKRENNYPQFIIDRFKSIVDGWEAVDFGAVAEDVEPEPEPEPEPQTGTARRHGSSVRDVDDLETMKPPPKDHPIWGVHGIMHGVVRNPGPRISYRLNPFVAKISATVSGHNSLEPGQWFPSQLVALVRGAHGSSQGGICGSVKTGAFSIVVSGTYDDLDHDSGNVLYYSGSKSHANEDPDKAIESNATNALRRTSHPVRVLRSHSKSEWAPSVGIRYDGLYEIKSKRSDVKNKKGGRYWQFRLERCPGQRDLEEICVSSPSPAQVADFERIHVPY